MTPDWDWTRAAQAIKDARAQLGDLDQSDLAVLAGVDRNTIGNLEGGRAYRRVPSSSRQVEAAIGWPTGTLKAIAEGVDPPPVVPLDQRGGPKFADGMPFGVRDELTNGHVIQANVVRFGGAKFIGILKVDDADSVDRDHVDEVMRAWADMQRHLLRLEATDLESPGN